VKRGLFVVVVLLAVSSLVAAMAYTSTEVTNSTRVEVASTGDALLSLEPYEGVGGEDGTARIGDAGMTLTFKFGMGTDGDWFGLQPKSRYEWNPLFKVTNNSEDKIQFHLEFNSSSEKPSGSQRWKFHAGPDIPVNPTGSNMVMHWTGSTSYNEYTLESGESAWVRAFIDTRAGVDAGSLVTKVLVIAEAID
jgi:hypothetical protein